MEGGRRGPLPAPPDNGAMRRESLAPISLITISAAYMFLFAYEPFSEGIFSVHPATLLPPGSVRPSFPSSCCVPLSCGKLRLVLGRPFSSCALAGSLHSIYLELPNAQVWAKFWVLRYARNETSFFLQVRSTLCAALLLSRMTLINRARP